MEEGRCWKCEIDGLIEDPDFTHEVFRSTVWKDGLVKLIFLTPGEPTPIRNKLLCQEHIMQFVEDGCDVVSK